VTIKIITKMIVERLKRCLSPLISLEWGGFVNGRKNFNGILVAAWAIHSIYASKEKSMFINLDMYKAYDRVRWCFLQHFLLAFGFHSEWISWVIIFMTFTPFLFLVNGSPFPIFSTSQGLRQGDPLSLYLFISMVEGLGRLLKKTKDIGFIHG
jgi:hypothetical protein